MLGAAGFGTSWPAASRSAPARGRLIRSRCIRPTNGFPNQLRTLPTAIIAQGAGIGIMVALPTLNWVIVHYSWHWAFGVLGIAGLVWSAAWLVLGREGPVTAAADERGADLRRGSAYRRLLLTPTMRGVLERRLSAPNGACRRRCPGRALF